MRRLIFLGIVLVGFSSICLGGQNAVVLTPSSSQSADLDKILKNNPATVIPVEEADIQQAGLLNNGGPVVVADPGVKGGYKVYDGATGADITKKFNSELAARGEPLTTPEPEPEQPSAVKPVEKPQLKEPVTFKKNHIGLSIGVSSYKKNEDSLDILAANNSGAQYTPPKNIGQFRLFYEHYFSEKYGLGVAAGTTLGNKAQYDMGYNTLNLEGGSKAATLYFLRRFGRHFSAYLGGGADIYDFTLDDPSNLAGVPAGPGTFEGNMVAPNAEAGFMLAAGNFALRFFLKQGLGDGTNEITRTANGTKYRLIVRNNNTVASKTPGQTLASNEKYFKSDLGGLASAVTLSYSFANW